MDPQDLKASVRQYRLKARTYRRESKVETDEGRREALVVLAETMDRLAAAYEESLKTR